jgi:Fur family transcriptional regulator, peroxide stress response regulator
LNPGKFCGGGSVHQAWGGDLEWRFIRIIPNIDRPCSCIKLPGAMKEGPDDNLSRQLSTSGFRFTPQRRQVYLVLLQKRDHPTAEEVFIRAKRQMPDISHATVYNCLEALVRSGLARQVRLDRGAARFCPNMQEHSHFYCDLCGRVFDIPVPGRANIGLPQGFKAQRCELTVHGECDACSAVGPRSRKHKANAKI